MDRITEWTEYKESRFLSLDPKVGADKITR